MNIGLVNGGMGEAQIVEQDDQDTCLKVIHLDEQPPPLLPICLILALPRPRMLHRILQTVTTLGVETLHLIQTAKVEKSFWQTPLLQPEAVHHQLILGLEQAKATQLPQVHLHKRFRPYMEDELPEFIGHFEERLVAHPGPYPNAPHCKNKPTAIAIGPEGGFLDKECELFCDNGFHPIQLGQRILKVETAVTVALAKIA